MFCTISQLLVNITTVLGDERDSSTCCGFFFKGDATNCSPDTVRLAGAMEHTAALTLMLKMMTSMMTVMSLPPKSTSISGQAYLLFVVVIEGSCVGRGVGGVPSSKPIARANVTW